MALLGASGVIALEERTKQAWPPRNTGHVEIQPAVRVWRGYQ